jgi:serine/threonine-protein kinase
MTDILDRLGSALADRYTIERELGAGGMATVYLAQDLRHDRKVAIKVLRPELAAVIGADRFLSEIKTTANLQHPHILPLFDSGAADSFLFYVMPYVEGESLRDRITREHQLPVADAVRLATEIAGALDYAHRQGVIHRDIKPENVMLHDGQALVADFGIALAMANTAGTRMTETGMSLGTPHYMSPEQAMGEREITGRSDVYALGAITYEMLCGEPPFTGPTAQAIIARVMTEEPRGLTIQRKSIPPAVEGAVRQALEKLPADRFATAAEFAAALKDPSATSYRSAALPVAAGPSSLRRGLLIGAVAGTVAGIVGVTLLRPPDAAPSRTVQTSISLSEAGELRAIANLRIAISPDGSTIVYVGGNGTGQQLWVRDISALEPRPLVGTEGAYAPFFSPDGGSLGYFVDVGGRASIRAIPVAGGTSVTVLADSVSGWGADWGDDGNIYFSHANLYLARVPATGGQVTRVSQFDSVSGSVEHDYPRVLPGSKFATVMLWKGSVSSNLVGVVDLATGMTTPLFPGTHTGFTDPNLLVVGLSDGRIQVVRFDPETGTTVGEPMLMVEGVQVEGTNGTVQFAVSRNGSLLYQRIDPTETGGMVWVARDGTAEPVDTTTTGLMVSPALSPDGRYIAVALGSDGKNDIWIKDLVTGSLTKLSLDVENADRPLWSRDGASVIYMGTRDGLRTAWAQRADGSDLPQRVFSDTTRLDEVALDPSGTHWVARTFGSGPGSRRLMIWREGVDTAFRPLIESRYDHYGATISPDGQWMAYVSAEGGGADVYVRPFPEVSSARYAVSVGGGSEPAWSRDGSELFYRSNRGDIMSVELTEGSGFSHLQPRKLLENPGMIAEPYHRSYDVTPDGQRFLGLSGGGTTTNRLEFVLNWGPQVLARLDGRQ